MATFWSALRMKTLPFIGKVVFVALAPIAAIAGSMGAQYRIGPRAIESSLIVTVCFCAMGIIWWNFKPAPKST